jgi:putative DNA primase/helicase
MSNTDRANDALLFCDPSCSRDDWVKLAMAAKVAGISFDEFNQWSTGGSNYQGERDTRSMWNSIHRADGITVATLFKMAASDGWRPAGKPGSPNSFKQPRQAAQNISPSEVWNRCKPATDSHPYIVKKQGSAEGLRVVPSGEGLRGLDESMVGALVVPVYRPNGTISTLQLIPPPEVAQRLKAKGKPGKLNLPGASLEDGWFTVGELTPGGVMYVCEGIGQAWSCWKATGRAAIVTCGWGRMRKVATKLRQRDASARLVLVPDVGKESDAAKIAQEVGTAVVTMPGGWPQNSDVNDLAQRDGMNALSVLLEGAKEPPQPEPRYKLLNADDLRSMPALAWRVRAVLPAVGLAGLYGPSASGKSFLALDLAAAIAEGCQWFGCRVEAAPVVYAALEGEGGFKLRVAAWEMHTGRALPSGLHMVLQSFKLTEPQDVADLAAVVPAGAVVFLDTLNRAAPTADENSSKDMGEILSAAKQLQSLINGLVVLVHHTGKDAAKGLRGHSSLFAALDAAVEVSRNGDRREWRVAKSKDGEDGQTHAFTLEIKTLGTDDYGDSITSCVVVRDTAAQDVKRAKVPQGGIQKLVLDTLRPMFKNGSKDRPGVPPLAPYLELKDAILAGSAKLIETEPRRRSTRAREAIRGLVHRGLLGSHEGCLWLVQ